MTTELRRTVANARSFLFVPGHRPDRFDKAARAGADAVIIDLEDAVAPAQKAEAREHARRRLDLDSRVAVRINPPGTGWYADDVVMLRGRSCAVMLPKAESRDQIAAVVADLGGAVIIALVETASGILRTAEICSAPHVARAALGSVDLAAQLGIDPSDREALQHARFGLVVASAAAGIAAPIDSPSLDVTDIGVTRADAEHASRLGFTGKMCIHPRQVAAVHAAFTPSDEMLLWAREIVAAARGSVTVLHGQMIDKPVVDRALRLLERAPASN